MYRTVETGIWDDPRVLGLSPEGKLLFTFLFTNRAAHVSGVFPLPRVMMAYYTGLSVTLVDTLCDTLSRLGLARFDYALDLVFVVNMMKHQGRGEKNQRSAGAHMATLHNSFLVRDFLSVYPAVAKFVPDRVLDRVSEVRSPARAEQEQEQELDQEQEQEEELAQGEPPPCFSEHRQAPTSGAPPRATPARQERFDPGGVPIPPQLDSPEFRAAWTLRLRERSEKGSKGKMTRTAVEAQLGKLVKLAAARGLPAAVACVEKATEGGYQGVVFERDFDPPNSSNGSSRLVGPEAATMRRWGTKLAPGTTEAHIREAEEWDRQAKIAAEEDRVAWERDRAEKSVLHG